MRKGGLVIFLICAASVAAQFRILGIEPHKCGDQLCATVRMQEALTIKIEETIRSGLPAIMEFRILVHDRHQRSISKSVVHYKIQCDIWKDTYRVEGGGQVRAFHTIDSLQFLFQVMPDLPIVSLSGLRADESHRISIQAEVMPISASQSDKVRDWLVQADSDDAPFSAESRREGFQLSLSNLVSSLFSREKKRELQTDWMSSAPFIPARL